jgi:hypothetical protein
VFVFFGGGGGGNIGCCGPVGAVRKAGLLVIFPLQALSIRQVVVNIHDIRSIVISTCETFTRNIFAIELLFRMKVL